MLRLGNISTSGLLNDQGSATLTRVFVSAVPSCHCCRCVPKPALSLARAQLLSLDPQSGAMALAQRIGERLPLRRRFPLAAGPAPESWVDGQSRKQVPSPWQ